MSELHAAAAAAGLQRDWTDADGQPQRVADAALEAILQRLDRGSAADGMPTVDAGDPVSLPDGLAGRRGALHREDGEIQAVTIGDDGRLPGIGAIGYHRLEVGGRTIRLAVAPPRCPSPPPGRGWGVAVQIAALHGSTARPFGDFGSLAEAAGAFAGAGAAALAISPTHALFPADPTRFSAYAPSSRQFRNVLFADPALIGAALPPIPGGDLIDWPGAIPARMAALRAVWDGATDPIRRDVSVFRRQGGQALEAHARFDALHAMLGGHGWQDWPSTFHDPAAPAVARFAAEHEEDIAFHVFLQWLAEHSLAAAGRIARTRMGIGLIADLAVGVDAGGSDGWSRRGELLSGLTIGAPPDPLGPDGQNWGITALDPFALRRLDFAPFVETLRSAFAHAGGLRIDHALGLERLWVIPEGAAASEGAYLTMPGEDLRRIVAIEAHRAGAIVIGEDLGTVPEGFRPRLRARGMLGMRVLPFERTRDGGFTAPATWDPDAVAMTGTHDTPTLAGWWRGRDIDWRASIGHATAGSKAADVARRDAERGQLWHALGQSGTPPETAPIDAMLAHVASAPTPLAIVPVEDLLGLEEQPNLPGTIDEHPNWRRRLSLSADALLARPEVARRTALLTAERPG